MERIITKSFARLMGRGVHRGFITYEELNNILPDDTLVRPEKIDEILTEDQKEKEEIKSIKVGMTISEVEDIMGRPSEIIANGKDDKNQLWIYRYSPRDEVYLTFTNYRLFRIEQK